MASADGLGERLDDDDDAIIEKDIISWRPTLKFIAVQYFAAGARGQSGQFP